MSEDNWIGIITPTKDGKYMVARATVREDENIETLSDCVVTVSDADGKREDLKYPFVMLVDLEKVKEKLIKDLIEFEAQFDMEDEHMRKTYTDLVNRRFGVK